ncbi:patched domain-containing protein 3-like [Antedon mediterranea]|uniref:patched domain-containing protein 3-like n=1 Tax=Antedon mediterranea TaxID=105859 RepID=UPI003AF545F3
MAIGIDDVYILVASWRKTNVRSSVEDRLSETLSEAALSITITSLTDFLAFAVGCTSVFPGVAYFCVYNAVSIVFVYIYVLTFFLSCMVITGRREAGNKHCITWKRVVPVDEAPSSRYRLFCAGGPSKTVESSDSSHIMMAFFRDYFGPIMGKPWIKMATLLVYAMYVGVSTWGVTQLKQGLDLRDAVLKDSYLIPFQDIEQISFQTFGPLIQIVFTEEIDYWKPDVNKNIMNVHKHLETSKYGLNSAYFTDSWIRSFNEYLSVTGQTSSNRTIFLNILQNQFLVQNKFKQFELDIVFNKDRTRITSSRFLIGSIRQHVGLHTSEDVELMENFREIVADFEFESFAFSSIFLLYDQYKTILPATLTNLAIALIAMMIVSILFVPKPICSIWMVVSIASIELGVLGFMTFWGVRLDTVTMINIILCIGFSVDFTAHMSYVYTVSPFPSRNDKLNDAYYTIGMPISQAAISTLLGILVLVNSPTGIFISFFKTLFLVITIGLIHGLFFLPVLLSLSPIEMFESMVKSKSETKINKSKMNGNSEAIVNDNHGHVYGVDEMKTLKMYNIELTESPDTHSIDLINATNPAFVDTSTILHFTTPTVYV